jgi:diguanylate cyclase (GGDEF)-like protein
MLFLMVSNNVERNRGFFPRISIRSKFALVLVTISPALILLTWVGTTGLGRIADQAAELYGHNLVSTQHIGDLRVNLERTGRDVLQLIFTEDEATVTYLHRNITEQISKVDENLGVLRRDFSGDPSQANALRELTDLWQRFRSLYMTGVFRAESQRAGYGKEVLANRTTAAFNDIDATLTQLATQEGRHSQEEHLVATQIYNDSRRDLLIIAGLTFAASLGVVVWLTRNIVPRLVEYSSFAREVAAGRHDRQIRTRGSDELSHLGHALNNMVAARAMEQTDHERQVEFIESMQVATKESEAHDFLKRHIERSIPYSCAIVLNRNNSLDHLQATTPLPEEDDELSTRLADAVPQSCLAVRFARNHGEHDGDQQLVRCNICMSESGRSTCEPLVVGGEVIGSVLVRHRDALGERERAALGVSVNQAAPVLANLRNLAIAELRAATDALTGLPNQRASTDMLRQMVAQASRGVAPLAALLLDLDHFKQINDVYGHGRGDEVLAAVGAALQATLREGDFAGRYGGEEFLILLSATGREGAVKVGEKVRGAVAGIAIPSVPRAITASVGIAVLPDDAGEATALVRNADRALYRAKANGRNRVETFAEDIAEGESVSSRTTT